MNKLRLLSVLTVFTVVSALYLTSCKDDDDPEPRAKVSFSSANISVNEDQGDLPVTVVLDRALNEDVVVEYSISGSATRRNSTNAATADYQITGTIGEVLIPKGQTSGTINISILNDGVYEDDETIVLTIDDVDSDLVDFGERTQLTITIVSDDAVTVANFETTSFTVSESDGTVELLVVLDQPTASDLAINFTLSGSALDSIRGSSEDIPVQFWDYHIEGFTDKIVIPAGQSSVPVKINIYSDFMWEDRETIEVTLTNTPGVSIGTKSKATINVDQEDGVVVALLWPEDSNADTDVDMDLFIWLALQDDEGPFWFPIAYSIWKDNEDEFLFIPSALENATFAASYVYYSGTDPDLKFEVQFADFVDDQVEPLADRDVFPGSYTLDHINKWDETDNLPLSQMFDMVDSKLENFSELNLDLENPGGRVGAIPVPSGLSISKSGLRSNDSRRIEK